MKQANFYIIWFILVCQLSFGQQQELHIGDNVPNVYLPSIIHARFKSAHLHDFKGKLLLLDFWNQYCASCIANFPKLERLQQTYAGRIQILPVVDMYGGQKEVYEALYQKRAAKGQPINLPSVVNDTVLNTLFPHEGVPHIVWINPEGRVVAITDQFAVQENSIDSILSGKQVHFPVKHLQAGFDRNSPLLINGNGGNPMAFMQRILITPYLDSVPDYGFLIQQDSVHIRLFGANQTVEELYFQAFNYQLPCALDKLSQDYFLLKGAIWQEPISLHHKRRPSTATGRDFAIYNDFKKQYLYCMDLMMPTSVGRNEALKHMLRAINNYFCLSASIERRNCLIYRLIPAKQRLNPSKKLTKLSGMEPDHTVDILPKRGKRILLHSSTGSTLVSLLNREMDIPLVLDGTNNMLLGEFSLKVENIRDLEDIQKQLAQHDLHLVPMYESIAVIVIAQQNGK